MKTTIAVLWVDAGEPGVWHLDSNRGEFHDLPQDTSTHMTIVQDGGLVTTLVPLRWVRQIAIETEPDGEGGDDAA